MILTCPNCHEQFEVNQSHYASLLEQVRNKAFEEEIQRRLHQLEETKKAEAEAAKAKADAEIVRISVEKDEEAARLHNDIIRLKAQISGFESEKAALKLQAEKEIAEAKSASNIAKLEELSRIREAKERELALLKESKEQEINALKLQLSTKDSQKDLALMEEKNLSDRKLRDKEQEISNLQSQLRTQELEADRKLLQEKETNTALVRAKDEEIGRLKDMKARLSTKMIGETLEQHCENTFRNAQNMGAFPTATFEKDNDASSGTKGDFIFRDYIDGKECLSIMFEMKNEADTTATKHKNEDFFAKLHSDREKKKCEYAVLVTMLEADNELYNGGIVDVSYRHDKMYVVRPQFFMAVISLLSKSARKNADEMTKLRAELAVAKAQHIDVTNFEQRRDKFAAEFAKHFEKHQKKQTEALEAIDKAIADAEKQIDKLRRIKDLFTTSGKAFESANDVIQNTFTIKKLVHGNPTMRAVFSDAGKASKNVEAPAPSSPEEE